LALGFSPLDGVNEVYVKVYPQHDNYSINVDFANEKIDYHATSSSLRLWDTTTSNFDHAENFVVLECVDRLLEKGYSPDSIELERVYPSGRGHSGKLDILVNDFSGKDVKPFLMIECKTWETEYNKERNKMLKDGGQLFTYYKNATAAKHLCLYTSHLSDDGKIDFLNSIVDVQDEWRELSETKDIYEHWNKMFKDNGIFESYATPYNIVHKRLTYGMLQRMKSDDSGKIFLHILEILRHNGISDKPNAFNKLLNLFVCKIIDEDKNPDDELQFQCWEGLSDEDLQITLNDLYKVGMWRFLNIDVIDHSLDEVTEKLEGFNNSENKSAVLEMVKDLRLKKSPNFAFIEVLDNRTFKLNAKVVREIVELLQGYKFRYEQKHEFLGNFFELLLNTSMKQEAGQFFTPVPITRFIISSLPLREFVQKQVDERASDPLPTVIDYACGSGHFLTEFMSKMQTIIEKIDISNAGQSTRRKLSAWRGDVKFSWANEYVYGIDFDNRLVKTTKVSAFFNGDGEANIVWGNGLDSFEYSEEYRDKLKKISPSNKKDNGQFDILVSNPPYSVPAFKGILKHGASSFDLYSSLTDNSSEIECLFVERMKQLLKVGGWAGIILPSSILSNGGIYSRAREIIFKHFTVKAIVELGSGTFMKTNTSTIILFLERRSDNDHKKIAQAVDTFFKDGLDVTVAGIEHAFSKFVANVYGDLSFNDYVSFINREISETMKAHDLWLDYVREFGNAPYEKAFSIEREKLLYFLLTFTQNIVVAKSGQKADKKAFLGYEFSERRGSEGIKDVGSGTMLFDKVDDILSPQKINSYIHNAFLGKPPMEVDEVLEKNLSYSRLSSHIEYGTKRFEKQVSLNKRRVAFATECVLRPIDSICNIEYGDRIVKANSVGSEYPVYGGGGETFRTNEFNREDRFIISRFGMSANCVRFVSGKFFLNDSGMTIVSKDENECLSAYADICLFSMQETIYSLGRGNSQKNIDIDAFGRIKIPLPPLDIQNKIVTEFKTLEREEFNCRSSITKLQELLLKEEYFAFEEKKLSNITTMVKRGKSAKYGQSTIQIIKSGQARGYLEFDFTEKHYVDDSFVSDERNLRCGDLLINSTGVGTAGRVTLFNLDGEFVADSHITIIRLDEKQALPKYVLYALADIGFKNIETMATGQSGQIEISLDIIKNIRVPLPPMEKQKEIVAEIEKCEIKIESLHEQLNELKNTKSNVLNKHF